MQRRRNEHGLQGVMKPVYEAKKGEAVLTEKKVPLPLQLVYSRMRIGDKFIINPTADEEKENAV